jgi:ethanolamine utilization protein EutQ
MTSQKTPAKMIHFDQLEFSPRFEYGEMAEVVETCGTSNGSELGTGWGRMTNAYIPWTIQYDEVLTVFEGELKLHANEQVHHLSAKDSIWLPAGTALIYEAESALIHFALHPSNWHQG